VRYTGFGPEKDEWKNWRDLEAQDAIDDFWDISGLDKLKPAPWDPAEDGLRCTQCFKLFKVAGSLKGHHTKKQCKWAVASRKGTKAEKAIRQGKKAAAHKAAGVVLMEGEKLKSAFTFKYLGVTYSADGDRDIGRQVRAEQAADRYRQLGNVWNSAGLSEGLKLRLYEAGVISVLVYGCETWNLTEKTETWLRAWNARRLAMITGREIRDEYKDPAFDLVGSIRARRLKWAGELLRREKTFLPRRVAIAELERYGGAGHPGGIFQDAPKGVTLEELVYLASYEDFWGKRVESLRG
jgi:hypothetical protein